MHLSGTEHSARANIFGGRLFFTLTSDPEWPESCRRLTGDSDADGKSEAKTNRLRVGHSASRHTATLFYSQARLCLESYE